MPLLLGAFLLGFGSTEGAPASLLITYPTPANAQSSDRFSVSVNGQPVFVEMDRRVSFVHFAFAGEAHVEVFLDEDFQSYTLSPLSYGISSSVSGNRLSFTLARPRKLVLHEVNGGEADFVMEERLVIFADPIPEPAEQLGINPLIRSGDLLIDDSGEVDVTAVIQAALDDLSAAGGGLLVMEPGLYLVQSLFMRDDVTIYLEGGARLQGSDVPSADDGMIKFFAVDRAHLRGPGSVDANGVFLRYQRGKWWSIVRADNASDCSLDTVTLLDTSGFAVWIRDSERWRMRNTKQIDFANRDLGSNAGEDGVDPDASRHVLVAESFIYSGDDATAIKAITPTFPVIEDITFRSNVIFNSAMGVGLGIGSELERSHLRDITFENNDVIAARFGLDLGMQESTSDEGDNPLVEQVRYRNNRFGKTRGSAVLIGEVARDGLFRDVWFENLVFAANQDGNGAKLLTRGDGVIDSWTFDGVVLATGLIDDEGDFDEVGTGVGQLTFLNDTPTIVTVEATRLTLGEPGPVARSGRQIAMPGSGEGGEGFRIRRTGDVAGELTVRFGLRGTAIEGVDVKLIGTSAVLPAGEAETVVPVTPLHDGAFEGSESLLLTLENDHGAPFMLGPDSQAQILLIDAELFRDGFESGDTSAWNGGASGSISEGSDRYEVCQRSSELGAVARVRWRACRDPSSGARH